MTVVYEWDCEIVADGDSEEWADGDCIEHCHGTSYADVREWAKRVPPAPGTRYSFVLVRDTDADINEEQRTWAYVWDDVLSPVFENSIGRALSKTPKRFIAEVAKYHAA